MQRNRTTRPYVEPLEDRTLMSTCHVTRLSDSGVGKGFRGDLRCCINKVNAEPGPDVIDFTVTGTINLNSVLPDLASDIDIQGPGAGLLTVRRNGPPKASPSFRIFRVTSDSIVQIAGLKAANGFETQTITAGSRGGGIYNSGVLTMRDVIVDQNVAQDHAHPTAYGGGIFNDGSLTIEASTISGNSADGDLKGYGGGIYNSANLTIIDTTVISNKSFGEFGGGGGIASTGLLSIYSSTLVSNQVDSLFDGDGHGGAVFSYEGGSLVLINSTVANNEADGLGAIYLTSGFHIISHSTVSHNTDILIGSGGPGGGIMTGTGLFMRNTIVAKNSSFDVSGVLTSSGYNLIGDSSDGAGYAPTDILDVDPMLGPLADNGGPTLTHALLPGSPAIDAGDNPDAPEFDQRGPGFPRIVNGTIDIGAFEVQATNVPSIPPLKKEELDGGEVQPSSTIGGIRSTLEPPPILLEMNSQPQAVRMLHRPAMETALASEFEALLTDLNYTPFV